MGPNTSSEKPSLEKIWVLWYKGIKDIKKSSFKKVLNKETRSSMHSKPFALGVSSEVIIKTNLSFNCYNWTHEILPKPSSPKPPIAT